MPVSVDYVARETVSNLWRNRLMTVAAVLTVAVSLSLVGSALLVRQSVAHATARWQHGVNVLVFLSPNVTSSQQASVTSQLQQLPYVQSCVYRSSQYDYNEARHILAPDVSQALTVATMPSSLRCVLNDPAQAQAVYTQFHASPGVLGIHWPSQAVRNMENVTHIAQWVVLSLAVILLLSASVLILNTIRLAIFARRREVSVMKLVGATNWFIRVPFMCEGLVQGLFGALIAALAVTVLHWVINYFATNPSSPVYQFWMPTSQLVVTNIVVVVVGLLVGTLGSAFAIRRFLDA
ncbi:MAG TPA: permease-like cell division protein FtsX [Acidimicrobiales bacterium]|nr:permease-like cell division protein FtsX [Acidimicrobiales bacterium]